MGILNRLGSVINSYINDIFEDSRTERSFSSRRFYDSRRGDPDLDAAFDELNDYLNRNEPRSKQSEAQPHNEAKLPPEHLRPDFEYLGVPFGADAGECKAAYKKLLKIHHPDRHAGHEGNFKKATEKSAKINAAWDRIEGWRNAQRYAK